MLLKLYKNDKTYLTILIPPLLIIIHIQKKIGLNALFLKINKFYYNFESNSGNAVNKSLTSP
jgi:hypothetical protein